MYENGSSNRHNNRPDFDRLASELLNQSTSLLYEWFPAGKVNGNEFEVGDLSGSPGRSLRINIRTGKWADFSTDVKGGDLISLYAAMRRIGQGDAYRELSGSRAAPSSSLINGAANPHRSDSNHRPPQSETPSLVPVPEDAPEPTFRHKRHGPATQTWAYTNADSELLYFISRHDTEDGKQFIPWSWNGTKWVNKAWPEPRPLYNLARLSSKPDSPVLIVEGEKACDAAETIAGNVYTVVTWQGGSLAWKKTDLTPIYGRRVLLWPDADATGVDAMCKVGAHLLPHVPEVKILDVGTKGGWDAADALAEGMDWTQFKTWAKGIVRTIEMNTVDNYSPTSGSPTSGSPEPQPQPPAPPSESPVILEPMPDVPSIHISSPTDPEPPPQSLHAVWERLGLAMTQRSGPIVNVDNAVRILEGWPEFRDLIWFDEFHQRVLTSREGSPREWRDVDDIWLTVYCQRSLGLPKMTTKVIREAVEIFSFQHTRNEPRDWMAGLTWDQTPRVETFFIDCFGSEDTPYIRAASRNWWIAMAARVFDPGCKFDNMVVLEGNQGRFKSTALNIIGGDWFMEATETIGSKDFLQALNGKLLVEIAELDSFSKADVRSIKKTISCRVDTYRASYGRRAQDFRRRCVFVGTTNDDEYLDDPTGGRRFWPIKIGAIDLDRIKTTREQLFAEAAHRFKRGESWWQMPDSAIEEQDARRRYDAWEDVVVQWVSGRDRLRLCEIARGALGIDAADLDKRHQLRLGAVLRSIGWERRVVKIAGRSERIWVSKVTYLFENGSQLQATMKRPAGVRNYAPGAESEQYPNLDR